MVLRSLRWPSDHRFGIENMADTEVKPVKYLCVSQLSTFPRQLIPVHFSSYQALPACFLSWDYSCLVC